MKWLTTLFTLFIILIIVLADQGNLGILKVVNEIPYGDKAGHFILYGMLTLLLDLTLMRSLPDHSPKLIVIICGLISCVNRAGGVLTTIFPQPHVRPDRFDF